MIAVKILLVMVHQFVSYSLVQFWALDFLDVSVMFICIHQSIHLSVYLKPPSEKFETRTPPDTQNMNLTQTDQCGLYLRVFNVNIRKVNNFLSNAGSLTCSIVQFILWWFWAVHSSRTCWALWAREALWWNVCVVGGASSTCAAGEQIKITHDIQPSVKRENTGLTGCFSG